jgi:hypothetical protein
MLALILTAFVVFLMRLRPSLANAMLEVVATLAIVVVAATAFIFMGMIEGTMAFQFGKRHKRELLSYLLLGLFSLGCGLYLAVSDSATIQTVALVAAPHAFLFGLAELRLGQHLEHHVAYRKGLTLGGIVEVLIGIALVSGSQLSSERAALLLICVVVITIVQLMPLVFYFLE